MRRDREQLVVTGVGILSAIGHNKHQVLQSMRENRSGVGPIKRFDTGWAACHIGAEVKGYDPSVHFAAEELERYDLCTQYAILSGQQAVADSGIDLGSAKRRTGLVLGTCNGGLASLESARSVERLEYGNALRYLFYYQSDATAAHLGLQGPVTTIVTACAASGNAIGLACDLIRAGHADFMLAGGSDAMAMSVYAGFNILQALNASPCSPYSKAYGLSLGEGAAMVLIEPLSSARARGAHIYAEVRSYGLSSDAYHITAPEPEGAGIGRSVSFALRDGGVMPGEIDYVNTHGTGTQANDAAELRGLRGALGPDFADVRFSSSKPYFGHCLGAAAAIELVSSLLALEEGLLPATLHFEEPRPGCEEAGLVTNAMQEADVSWFISTNAAFGGNNTALLLQRNPLPTPLPKTAEHRVVITGLGYVSPFGYGQSDLNTQSERIEAGAVDAAGAFSLKEYDRRLYERRMNPLTQACIGGADLALRDAQLGIAEENAAEVGLLVASSRGSLASAEKYLQPIFESGGAMASSIYFPDMVLNSTAGRVAMKLNLKGFASTLAGGGTCGLISMLYGSELVRSGRQTYCLVGGGDEQSRLSSAVNEALNWPEPRVEGSAFALLERLDSAQNRGARVYAEVLGFGAAASGQTGLPEQNACRAAVRTALEQAGLRPEEVGSVYLSAAIPSGEPVLGEVVQQLFAPGTRLVMLPEPLRYADSVSSLYAVAVAVSEMAASARQPSIVLALSAYGNYSAVVIGPAGT